MNNQPHDSTFSRRTLLQRGASAALGLTAINLLAGCSSTPQQADLPDPVWPTTRSPSSNQAIQSARPPQRSRASTNLAIPDNVISRGAWAKGQPVPRLMDPMQPIYRITIHHDGMTPFTSTSRAAAAQRIENIRKAHRGNNWGDIGYHFTIDPAGRAWAARPLQWQGAHVKEQNEGNIGICVMGNYERQRPNQAQLDAVEDLVAALMRQHRVALREVRTHREMAPTACPGRNLQPRLVAMRNTTGALASV